MNRVDTDNFHARLNKHFYGILQWQQLDALWARVKTGRWYFYQVGEALPDSALHGEALARQIDALDALLRQEHDYHYCGIVYADDVDQPALIKVYDPNQIGSACSNGAAPSPPGWILSARPPMLIEVSAPVPNNRRRWWRLFSQ